MTKKNYDVTIIESLRQEDHASHLLVGQCLKRALRLFGLTVKYIHCATRAEFLAAVEGYTGRSFAIHFSAHGDNRSIQTADYRSISWCRLAKALAHDEAPDVLSFSACASLATSKLADALHDRGLTPWVVGPSDPDGICFDDACVAFPAFYRVLAAWRVDHRRPLSTLRSDKTMMRDALDRMHAASDGVFRFGRWSDSRSKYVYGDVEDSARRLIERFAEPAT